MLTAAAVVNENHIVMLCVLPEYRGHGLGSALLAECEDTVRGQGYQTIYTYTAIIPMYARSGYRVSMKYFMGEKQL